jgi:aerobic C4-dicarboxylate transport protein
VDEVLGGRLPFDEETMNADHMSEEYAEDLSEPVREAVAPARDSELATSRQ